MNQAANWSTPRGDGQTNGLSEDGAKAATDTEIERARESALSAILDSAARHKVVVAGPGTGKTHTFKKLLADSAGSGLAITFLTALVDDLATELDGVARVRTFHGLCKGLLHANDVDGITRRFHYYPPLKLIMERDLSLDGDTVSAKEIESALMNLQEEDGVVESVLRCGDYYDAVGHTDAVYRMLRHLRGDPACIPSFDQIVVDEYQDFSLLEVELIDTLASKSPILIVGDDDQALYGFRHASAIYLRSLVDRSDFTRFELPYCSRCTEVLVEATNHVVRAAKASGLLESRIDKAYLCYMPSKRVDSDQYPRIVHAHCTVETNRAPIMSRYVARQIAEIPAEDIDSSIEGGHPTVLVIGPTQFTRRIYRHLEEQGTKNLRLKTSNEPSVEPLDGYLCLADNPTSRLGWRILLYCQSPTGWEEWVTRSLLDGEELVTLVDSEYEGAQLAVAQAIARLADGTPLSSDDEATVEAATGLSLSEITGRIGRETIDQDELSEEAQATGSEPSEDATQASVLVTSLVGAKGLQAEHVFVVGLNNGHFPRDNRQPTDDEVCKLIVALTRARKSCTLVSCDRFGKDDKLAQSVFVTWLSQFIESHKIDAASLQ